MVKERRRSKAKERGQHRQAAGGFIRKHHTSVVELRRARFREWKPQEINGDTWSVLGHVFSSVLTMKNVPKFRAREDDRNDSLLISAMFLVAESVK